MTQPKPNSSGCFGILVGCDKNQEWLLSWWWEHYSRHNSYPVAFADLGMSPQAIAWCKERGSYINLPPFSIPHENEICELKKEQWENRCGKELWFCRSAWFKKPLALLHSPFSLSVWLDLDCQINGSLEPLFNSLVFGADIGLVREPLALQLYEQEKGLLLPGEINYNSGVIAFRQGATILDHWMREATENNETYIGDQSALSRAIFLHRPELIELPTHYNWLRSQGENPDALIYHFVSGEGKIEILKKAFPHLIKNFDSYQR